MKTIALAYDKIVYSRTVLKWGAFFLLTAFTVSKCTYAGGTS